MDLNGTFLVSDPYCSKDQSLNQWPILGSLTSAVTHFWPPRWFWPLRSGTSLNADSKEWLTNLQWKKALKITNWELSNDSLLTSTLVLAYLVPASTLTQRHDSPICEKKALKMDLSTDSLLAFTLVLASAVVAASMLIQSSPIQLEVDSPFSPFHFSIETVTSYLFNCWTNVDNFSCNQTYDAVSLTSSMKYHGQHANCKLVMTSWRPDWADAKLSQVSEWEAFSLVERIESCLLIGRANCLFWMMTLIVALFPAANCNPPPYIIQSCPHLNLNHTNTNANTITNTNANSSNIKIQIQIQIYFTATLFHISSSLAPIRIWII